VYHLQSYAKKKQSATHARLLNRLLAAAWQTRKSSGARRFQVQARRLMRLFGELASSKEIDPAALLSAQPKYNNAAHSGQQN